MHSWIVMEFDEARKKARQTLLELKEVVTAIENA
jgi:hypothetical protein